MGNVISALAAGIRAAVAVLAGSTAAQSGADGSAIIHEIEAGDGPAWGTLSGLTAHPTNPLRLYAVTDQDSPPARIVEIELGPGRARVIRQIPVTGEANVDLDLEAIAAKADGGFWIASEGSTGNVPANRLIEVDATGRILRTIGLPDDLAPRMGQKGLEGVTIFPAADGWMLAVAFQAAINGDPEGTARIGVVDPRTQAWRFHLYPLERTDKGDWTGLSEILHLKDQTFAAIERDGRGGRKSIKLITTFDLDAPSKGAPGPALPRIVKRRAVDLVPLFLDAGRKVEPEVEGLARAVDGQIYVVTDNDNERPTVLLRLGDVARLF